MNLFLYFCGGVLIVVTVIKVAHVALKQEKGHKDMDRRFQTPWSLKREDLSYEPSRTYETPKLPGMFPTEIRECEAGEPDEIHELPAAIPYDTPVFDSRFSNMRTPFDWQSSGMAPNQSPGSSYVPYQQQGVSYSNHSSKSPNRSSTMPKVGNLSILEQGKSNRSSSKELIHSKLRTVSKSAVTAAPNDIVIAIFGLTGTGKSSFISKLTGKDVKIGHGLQSCTSEIEQVQCKIGSTNVTLVDTPGFDDTNRTDTEILTLIASWMKDAYDVKTRLTGVIYLHRISDNKMSGSSYKNLKMFRSLCGTKNLSHVILATTMWDTVTLEQGADREDELLSKNNFWGQMKDAGSMVRRYDNTEKGAIAMVTELLNMSPIVLKIQDEVAVQKKKLIDTQAGQSINEALIELSKKHDADLAEIKQDLVQALKEKDDTWQKELEAERKKLADQIKANEESKRALRMPINSRAWYQQSWRCRKCKSRLTIDGGRSAEGPCPKCGLIQKFI